MGRTSTMKKMFSYLEGDKILINVDLEFKMISSAKWFPRYKVNKIELLWGQTPSFSVSMLLLLPSL